MALDALSFSIDVEHFALVTHKVPAARVRPRLPDRYELQTFEEKGVEFALVSATCFCNRDFRPTPLPYPRHTFNENTFRTYVTYNGQNAVFFLARYLGTSIATTAQKAFDRHVYQADFEVAVDGNDAGYPHYECRSLGPLGETWFSIEATDPPASPAPFSSGDEHAQFMTYRLDGHFTSTVGMPAHCPVSHARLAPFGGHLRSARFDVWVDLGILKADEAEHPYSILISTGTRFLLAPPRPAL